MQIHVTVESVPLARVVVEVLAQPKPRGHPLKGESVAHTKAFGVQHVGGAAVHPMAFVCEDADVGLGTLKDLLVGDARDVANLRTSILAVAE